MYDLFLHELDSALLRCYMSVTSCSIHNAIDPTYQEYDGKLNFTTDAWTSTNHRAFVAVLVHLEHNGVPMTLPLDVIEAAKVQKRLTWGLCTVD